ncbi:MAG: YraN family protein [Candidatus Eremiobacteraeota bacterium]|nr:YraN family protein [Candidatus Eremiobacteraeota bacterium]
MSAQTGRAAEDAAAAFVESLGYRIVKRNLRGCGAEIDLVASDGDVLVFLEVKARAGRRFGSAISAVDARKRARIRALAADFLQFFPTALKVRFDIVTMERGKPTLHRGAFS